MEFSIGMIIFAISFLIYYYFFFSSTKSKSHERTLKTPPEAGGAKPLVGHLHLMGGTDTKAGLPHFNLGDLADRYGPVYTIRLGVRRALVVSDWKVAKELYTTHDATISNRPKLRAFKHLGYDFAMFGFTPYSPYWREIRKLISVELLSSRRLEMLSTLSMSEIKQSSRDLYESWNERRDPSTGKLSVDMKQWFGDLNLNAIFRMVAGKRFYDGGPGAEEGKQQRRVMRDLFHYAGLFVPADAFPYLGWLDLGGHEKKMKQIAKDLDKIMTEWLIEHREKANKGFNNKDQDFMDLMIAEMNRGSLKADQYDADTVIKSTIVSLIAGATDTTAVMLEWMMSLLLNHPGVLEKAQQEVDQQVGRERRVNESDVSRLPYLQAIIKESFRLYPAGPLGGPREFTEDATVGGYHVPKGTWLIVNLWKLQRDPKVWSEDASEFKPERFLAAQHRDLDIKGGQDFEIIPFGAGRRICPGSNFGIQMLNLVFASVLQAFNFSTIGGNKVDMTESSGMTNAKATPLDVLLSPRLSAHLY